jgi:hypothetical protein
VDGEPSGDCSSNPCAITSGLETDPYWCAAPPLVLLGRYPPSWLDALGLRMCR